MSVVTNYILKVELSMSRMAFVNLLNEKLVDTQEQIKAAPFREVTEGAGGNKAMEVTVHLAALNYFAPHQMVAAIEQVLETFDQVWDHCGYHLGNVELYAQQDQKNHLERAFPPPDVVYAQY